MNTKPVCYNSKGERKKATFDYDPMDRYRNIARGIYAWDGLPEDVPEGYIEDALFDYGCVSAKEVDGIGLTILPAAPSTFTVYNQPKMWLPTGLRNMPTSLNIQIASDNPCLYLGKSTRQQIEIFAGIMKSSLISLQQNVIGLRQPIALDGVIGNGAEALVISQELEDGEMYIPVIDGTKLGVKVIDLEAKDNTQSLISTFNAMDSEILSIIGVKNTGTEKASGITVEETLSVSQELSVISTVGLIKRLKWCERINKALGVNFSVEISDAYAGADDDMDGTPDPLDNKDKAPEEL